MLGCAVTSTLPLLVSTRFDKSEKRGRNPTESSSLGKQTVLKDMEQNHSFFVSSFLPKALNIKPDRNGVKVAVSRDFPERRYGGQVTMSSNRHDRSKLVDMMKTWGKNVTLGAAIVFGSVGFAGKVKASSYDKRSNDVVATPVEMVRNIDGVRGLLDSLRLGELPGLNMNKHVKPPPPKVQKGLVKRVGENVKPRASTSFVTKAVQTVGAAVVRIDTERFVESSHPGLNLGELFDDPVMKKFFAEKFKMTQPPPGERNLEKGQGSGFLISADGLLVTNAHVVKNVSKCKVTLTDGTSYEGTVKGADELFDVAVIKIDGKGRQLPVAKMGVSENMQVGDWVIAVGNPVGLDNTVTLGIVSSLNRSSDEVGYPDKRLNFIQTDAAINLGNSGGPLVNEFGEVVGINTCVRANAEGIGFAIPVDRVRTILNNLARGEKVRHPFVGIHMATITPDFAKRNNSNPNAHTEFPEVDGVIVMRISPNSPAAQCGLRRHDVIIEINEAKVKSAKDAQRIFDSAVVGQVMKMRIVRGGADGKQLELAVKTGDISARLKQDPSSFQLRPAEPLPNTGKS